MRPLRLLACSLAIVAAFAAMTKKPEFAVRFHVETVSRDTAQFAMEVALHNPERKAFVERTASISERHVAGVYPFPAPDGTFGCLFKLDEDGRLALEALTTQQRGRALVGFVGTKTGMHQVVDMQIDRPVLDGIITMQHGLTALEVEALKKHFKPVLPKGATPEPKKKGKMKLPWTH